jgi:hypothetical protein
VLLMIERTLDYLFVFVVTEPDLKKKSPTILTPIGHLFGCQILVVKWSGYGMCCRVPISSLFD